MTLFKRGNKWWAYIWVDGVRHHKATGTSNRRQAEAIERQFHDVLNETRHRLPKLNPEMTFAELTARFIAAEMTTPYSLDRLNHLLPFFSDTRWLISINHPFGDTGRSARRRRWLRSVPKGKKTLKSVKAATVNRDLSVLRRNSLLGRRGRISRRNPLGRCDWSGSAEPSARDVGCRRDQTLRGSTRALAAHFPLRTRHWDAPGEILHQLWEDIDFDNRILHVTHSKTPGGEMREIPLTSRLYAMLEHIRKQHTSNSGPVFTFEDSPLKNIKTTWAQACAGRGFVTFDSTICAIPRTRG